MEVGGQRSSRVESRRRRDRIRQAEVAEARKESRSSNSSGGGSSSSQSTEKAGVASRTGGPGRL